MESKITLEKVMEHVQNLIQSMEIRMNGRIDSLQHSLNMIQDDTVSIKLKIEKTRMQLSRENDAIDNRLDEIEVPIVEQKHEERIQRLEHFAGFTK